MSAAHFTLSDVDPEIPRKDMIRMGGSGSKPLSTLLFAKKRKIEEIYDLQTPASNLLTAADLMIEELSDKIEQINKLTASQQKATLKLEKAKHEIKILKNMLSRKSDHINGEGSSSRNTLIEEVKRDATIAVLESKIHMAMEAAENGLDVSFWDVKGWQDKLENLKDDFASNPFNIGLVGWKAPKAAKAPKSKSTKSYLLGEAHTSKDDEDKVVAEGSPDSESSSGEEGK